jgi:hypothetical protein
MMNTIDTVDVTPFLSRSERLAAVNQRIDRYRAQLLWSMDALIPADPSLRMPSASQAGVLDQHLPEVLLIRDDLADDFFKVIELLPMLAPGRGLEALEALAPKDFETYSRLVAGAFFLNQEVNQILRYPGQQAMIDAPDYDEIIEAIEPVMERGDIYIHC